ncbi:MAG: glycosyltransferase [Flavobacteriales bacterium]|nr:glycosyltransferase [Flavobacteriales bacterium]
MGSAPKFSLISPTYGRPAEVEEFLESLTRLDFHDFEVILCDGSPGGEVEPIARRFEERLPLFFIYEKNIAVSPARNRAAQVARGEWLIFLDSDCLVPPHYLQSVAKALAEGACDVFGGPDLAARDFSLIQKAISHVMTSFLTTGGLRGGRYRTSAYRPRSFNMGVRREAFQQVGGFGNLLCGEDVDLSIRLEKAGFRICFLDEAFVYHKRRTTWKNFFRQVYRFGAARLLLARRHRGELKATHLFPVLFTAGMGFLVFLFFFHYRLALCGAGLYAFYLILVGIEATLKYRNPALFFPVIWATCCQFWGYALGFLHNVWQVYVRKKPEGLRL